MLTQRLFHASRRLYATEAHKLVVNFAVPHAAILSKAVLNQVNLSTTDGDMGILAGHVPTILQLRPSVVDLISSTETTKYFVSGGFAVINPDSSLNINAVEAVPLAELDKTAAKEALDAAKKLSNSANEEEKTTGLIQVELLEAVLAAKV